jgi:Secretion system C-terminal sorting domain
MKHTKFLLSLLFLSGLSTAIQAQNTIPATGGNPTGSGGSVSYTVGQITYQSISGTNGIVTQGVQQPYEISVVTALEEAKDINLNCSVYPNPTAGTTKLIFESPDFENLKFRLFDLNGELLQDKKVESRETEISLENLSSSVYFLKVIKNNQEVKVFKIVKK